jgi:hypothetical protein
MIVCFLLIVPLKILMNYQRFQWCISSVNNIGNAFIAGVIIAITGINDTGEVVDHHWSVLLTLVSMTSLISTTPLVHASPVLLTTANQIFFLIFEKY